MSTCSNTIVAAIEEILKTLRHSITVPHFQDISSLTTLHAALQDVAQAFIRNIGPVDNPESSTEDNVEAAGLPQPEVPTITSSCLKRPREDDDIDDAETGRQSPSRYEFTSPNVLVDRPIHSSEDEIPRGRTTSRPKKRQRFADGIPSPPPRHGSYVRIRRRRDTSGVPLDAVHSPSGVYHRSTRPVNGDNGIPHEIILVTTDPDMLALRKALATTLLEPDFLTKFLRFAETYDTDDLEVADEPVSPPSPDSPHENTTADSELELPHVNSNQPPSASSSPSRGRGSLVRDCPRPFRKMAKKDK